MKTKMIKRLLVTAFMGMSILGPASAVTFDSDTFGRALNGWKKNRTASYSIDNHSYRTHRPTLTRNPGGGLFISARVEHMRSFGKKTTSYIELSYSAEGTLVTAQIRIMAGDYRINSGLINRPALAGEPAEGEAPAADTEPWNNPTGVMVQDLFKALDNEVAKMAKAGDGKKDIFSRAFGRGYDSADLAAALRHNLNLLMACVR